MRPDICIAHAPCQDGYTAAWVVHTRWPDCDFVQGVYGEEPPDVTGKDVLIVDFSYKAPVLREMAMKAATITVIDHHKSAEADLAAFAVKTLEPYGALAERADFMHQLPIQALFDMTKSGAMLAWEYCYPGAEPLKLIQHVQDRDLWKFELKGTREICADLFSRPYTFEEWDEAAKALQTESGWGRRLVAGQAIERKHHKDVAELLKITTRYMVIGGFTVPVANLPYTLASDAAGVLATHDRFGVCYYDRADGRRVFTLRSTADGLDVSEIAASYGGGGHKNAAGFTAANGWEGDV